MKKTPQDEGLQEARAEAMKIIAEAVDKALEILALTGVNQERGSWPRDAQLAVAVQGSTERLLSLEELRVHLKLPTIKAVHWLRRKKKIPCIRPHYRQFLFDRDEVDAALAKFTVKEASPNKGF